ncbi:MAG TPA: hypothetical protein DCR28_03450 [Eubacterium sp.]|nr:hypothetical protein [Eubacterium sp.]
MGKMTIDLDADVIEVTPEEVKMLENLRKMKDEDIVYDEDSPRLTSEQLSQFKRVNEGNQEKRRKQTVAIRLSPSTLKTYKALGKGYTTIIGRVLEYAANNAEFLKKFL